MKAYRIHLTDRGQALTFVDIALSKSGFGKITGVPETVPAEIASRYIDKVVFDTEIQPGMFFMYWSVAFEQPEECTETLFMVQYWTQAENHELQASLYYDGCKDCANNKPGQEAGLFCINNCVKGSMFKQKEPPYERKQRVSHITSMRTKGLLHRVQIMQELSLTDLEYGRIVDKAGRTFLTGMYPEGMKEFVEKVLKEKIYWNWWRTGFLAWEESYITWAYSQGCIPTEESFTDFIRDKAASDITAVSFDTMIKSLKHVKL
jgi:hypothetical protein